MARNDQRSGKEIVHALPARNFSTEYVPPHVSKRMGISQHTDVRHPKERGRDRYDLQKQTDSGSRDYRRREDRERPPRGRDRDFNNGGGGHHERDSGGRREQNSGGRTSERRERDSGGRTSERRERDSGGRTDERHEKHDENLSPSSKRSRHDFPDEAPVIPSIAVIVATDKEQNAVPPAETTQVKESSVSTDSPLPSPTSPLVSAPSLPVDGAKGLAVLAEWKALRLFEPSLKTDGLHAAGSPQSLYAALWEKSEQMPVFPTTSRIKGYTAASFITMCWQELYSILSTLAGLERVPHIATLRRLYNGVQTLQPYKFNLEAVIAMIDYISCNRRDMLEKRIGELNALGQTNGDLAIARSSAEDLANKVNEARAALKVLEEELASATATLQELEGHEKHEKNLEKWRGELEAIASLPPLNIPAP